jgi:Glycosyl hydrolase family 10
MGAMIFQLPRTIADEAFRHELQRASVTGGQDNMPYPTDVTVEGERLVLARSVSESGSLQVPWRIAGVGQLMGASATLMERAAAYPLPLELARGKINQVRSQTADWIAGGLVLPDPLRQTIHDATLAFGRALMLGAEEAAVPAAEQALEQAYQAADGLVHAYIEQVFQIRHQRQAKLESWQSCRLEADAPTEAATASFLQAFNTVTLPFSWQAIEPRDRHYQWEATDRLVGWAQAHGLRIIGGPLVDFAGRNLPDWLWENSTDLASMSQLIGDYVETVVRRYQSRVRTWQITAGSNWAGILARRDDELIYLTLKAAEAVRRVNPQLEIIVGLAQPWGDYLAEQERSKTPFVFADDLLRTGIKLAALDLELVMGVSPRGSYCRDLLETSRLLDLYTLLGVPLQATLAYPSSAAATEDADPDQRVNLGYWRDGYREETQAIWAADFAALALCKPFVRTVQWTHWSDAQPHFFPNCGLVDDQGREKASLHALHKLRSEHLK